MSESAPGHFSRRTFLHSTTLGSMALASRQLLAGPIGLTGDAICDLGSSAACESNLPIVTGVPLQPLIAQVRRLIAAAEYLGTPLPPERVQALGAAFKMPSEDEAAASIQRVLDCHSLVGVEINPEMRVKLAPGPAEPELVENGWRHFLIKVHNQPVRPRSCGGSAPRRGGSPAHCPTRSGISGWTSRCSTANRSPGH